MKDNTLTKRERDFLIILGKNKDIYFPMRISQISREMDLKMPTVEEIAERLVNKELVKKNGGLIVFTERGKSCYTEIIKKHRVMETFLYECGVDPDKACIEVSKFDYLIDEESADKIIRKIGNPLKCPHGYKIVESGS